jgi:hypothetical protein
VKDDGQRLLCRSDGVCGCKVEDENKFDGRLIPYFCAKVERINFLVQKEGILTRKNSVNRVEAGEF